MGKKNELTLRMINVIVKPVGTRLQFLTNTDVFIKYIGSKGRLKSVPFIIFLAT